MEKINRFHEINIDPMFHVFVMVEELDKLEADVKEKEEYIENLEKAVLGENNPTVYSKGYRDGYSTAMELFHAEMLKATQLKPSWKGIKEER